jgi:hypothetical protein
MNVPNVGETLEPPGNSRTVAVLVVHGVADQNPLESAQFIADADDAWSEPGGSSAGPSPIRKFVSADRTGSREEFCIGAGAYTH